MEKCISYYHLQSRKIEREKNTENLNCIFLPDWCLHILTWSRFSLTNTFLMDPPKGRSLSSWVLCLCSLALNLLPSLSPTTFLHQLCLECGVAHSLNRSLAFWPWGFYLGCSVALFCFLNIPILVSVLYQPETDSRLCYLTLDWSHNLETEFLFLEEEDDVGLVWALHKIRQTVHSVKYVIPCYLILALLMPISPKWPCEIIFILAITYYHLYSQSISNYDMIWVCWRHWDVFKLLKNFHFLFRDSCAC